MFRQIRRTLALTAAGACAAAVTASASFAEAVYDPYLDAVRHRPTATMRVQTSTSPASLSLIAVTPHTVYDSYLDALRHRPRSSERRLAIDSRSTPPRAPKRIGNRHAE